MADRERVGRVICGVGAGTLVRETIGAEDHARVAEARGLEGLADAERFTAEVLSEAALITSWVGVKVADGALTLEKLKRMRPRKALPAALKARKEGKDG